jgi:hypothetical protein
VRDERRVARSADLVPPRLELTAQRPEVVDLTVEDGRNVPALALDRLVARREVDDREAAVAEHAPAVGGDSAVVGAAVDDRVVHRLDPAGIGCLRGEKSADSAHGF